MVGLVARPTGGIVDSASGIMDAAKRVTEVTVEIHRYDSYVSRPGTEYIM